MSVTAPSGFAAAGVASGIKASGDPDLALVAPTTGPVPAAGVFTANLAAAAPVLVSRAHLAATAGRAAAVVLVSGNANAATGGPGVAAAERMCALVADGARRGPAEVLVCQTGLIGIPLPDGSRGGRHPRPGGGPRSGPDAAAGGGDRHHDHRHGVQGDDGRRRRASPWEAWPRARPCWRPTWPRCWPCSPPTPGATPDALAAALRAAVDASFNRMSVDGCTSTNDTVLVLASGASGADATPAPLAGALEDVCGALAAMMAGDAEGATTSGAGGRDRGPPATTTPTGPPARWPSPRS